MMATQTDPIFKPNRDKVALHLNTLFGDIPSGYEDGVIEISNLFMSEFFPVTSLDEAIDKAVELNAAGQVVYTTGSVLLPNTLDLIDKRRKADEAKGIMGKSYRALGEYFYYSNVCWVDIDQMPDTPEADKDLKKRYNIAKPNYYVVTSRETDEDLNKLVSTHFWWLLDKALFDKEELETANRGIIQALGGDKGTHNVTRLMKLGGIVAWPKKVGRITQMTENNNTDWFPTHAINDLAKAYPLQERSAPQKKEDGFGLQTTNKEETSFTSDDAIDMLNHISPDNHYFDWLNVGMALHNSDIPFEVWDNWSASGVDYAGTQKMRNKWNGFEKGKGVTIGTLFYHAQNNGYRARDYKPNSVSVKPSSVKEVYDQETGEVLQPLSGFNLMDWVAKDNFQGTAKEMEWLVEGVFPLGVPVLLAAMGGLGKSFSVLDMAVKIATPSALQLSKAFGGDVIAQGTAVYITAEDSKDSIHRRINSLVTPEQLDATMQNLIILPMPEIGHQLLIKDGQGGLETTDFFEELKEQLKQIKDLRLVAFDPLQAFVGADITAKPEAAQFMWSSFSNICATTGATLLCTHHMRKDGLKNIKSASDAREAIRGTTALIDGARLAYAMWQAGEDEGYKIAQAINEEYDPQRFVRGAVVKTNDIADQTIHSYMRQDSGILRDLGNVNISDAQGSGLTPQQAGQALREMRMRWEDGNPLRVAPQSPNCVVKWLIRTYRIKRDQAVWQRDNWICPPAGTAPLVQEKAFLDPQRNTKNGLFVVKIPHGEI